MTAIPLDGIHLAAYLITVLTGMILGGVSTTIIPRIHTSSGDWSIQHLLHCLNAPSRCPDCHTPIPLYRAIPILGRAITGRRSHCCHTLMPWDDTWLECSGVAWTIDICIGPMEQWIPHLVMAIMGWMMLILYRVRDTYWGEWLLGMVMCTSIIGIIPHITGLCWLIFTMIAYTILPWYGLACAMMVISPAASDALLCWGILYLAENTPKYARDRMTP